MIIKHNKPRKIILTNQNKKNKIPSTCFFRILPVAFSDFEISGLRVMYSVVTGRCLRKAQAHHPTYPPRHMHLDLTEKIYLYINVLMEAGLTGTSGPFFGQKNHGVLRRILMEINTNLSKPQQSSPTPDPWNTGQIFPYRNHRSDWCHVTSRHTLDLRS